MPPSRHWSHRTVVVPTSQLLQTPTRVTTPTRRLTNLLPRFGLHLTVITPPCPLARPQFSTRLSSTVLPLRAIGFSFSCHCPSSCHRTSSPLGQAAVLVSGHPVGSSSPRPMGACGQRSILSRYQQIPSWMWTSFCHGLFPQHLTSDSCFSRSLEVLRAMVDCQLLSGSCMASCQLPLRHQRSRPHRPCWGV